MFSFLKKLRGAKAAADEQNTKTLEQEQKEETDTAAIPLSEQPYRHVPTHAYQDALVCIGSAEHPGMPRARIREQPKERCETALIDPSSKRRSITSVSTAYQHSGRASLGATQADNDTVMAGPSGTYTPPGQRFEGSSAQPALIQRQRELYDMLVEDTGSSSNGFKGPTSTRKDSHGGLEPSPDTWAKKNVES